MQVIHSLPLPKKQYQFKLKSNAASDIISPNSKPYTLSQQQNKKKQILQKIKSQRYIKVQDNKNNRLNELNEFRKQGQILIKRKSQQKQRSAKKSLKKRPVQINFKFISPPSVQKNPLVLQPFNKQGSEKRSQKGFRRQVIPPSSLNHDKFKNFDENPQKFFVNLQEGLDNVFRKSKRINHKNCQSHTGQRLGNQRQHQFARWLC